MMDERSQKKLKSCHKDLQDLFNRADETFPFVITEGRRGHAKQLYLYSIGRTKVKKSKHNEKPSEAVDAYPAPLRWGDTKRMYYFAGLIKGLAESMKINIRWGGDWDSDTEILDNTFNDLGHFELVGD